MNDQNKVDRVIAVAGIGCGGLGILAGIPVTIIASLIFYQIERAQPPTFNVVPNQSEQSWQMEVSNPSPVSRRVTEVRFIFDRMLPPEKIIGAIELQRVVFEQSDYEGSTKTFRKVLHDVEVPGNGNLNLLFFFRNPKYKDHRILGRLEVYYDDRSEPNVEAYNDFPILCIE